MSFQGLIAHFFLVLKKYSIVWMDQFIYPFTYRRTTWVLPNLAIMEKATVNVVCRSDCIFFFALIAA